MATVFISVGSNVDAAKNVRSAVERLQQEFVVLSLSSVFESEPVGFSGTNFLNFVARFNTAKSVAEVQSILKRIEDEFGRVRDGVKFSPRSLDLDLLLYGCQILRGPSGEQILPRPEIDFNAFVLWPLAELAPHELHPISGKSYGSLWRAFDKNKQALWPLEFNWGSGTGTR